MILLVLPLVHHLSMLMGFGIVALMVLLGAVRDYWEDRWSTRRVLLDLALGPALFLFGLWYYLSVNLGFFNQVWNPDEVALFLSVALLLGAAAVLLMSTRRARPWFVMSKARRFPSFVDQKSLVIIGAFLLVLAKVYRPQIPGTAPTSPWLLLITLALLPMVGPRIVAVSIARTMRERNSIHPSAA